MGRLVDWSPDTERLAGVRRGGGKEGFCTDAFDDDSVDSRV